MELRREQHTTERLKRTLIALALAFALTLPGLPGACAGAESPENQDPEAAGQHPVSSVAFLREWIEENNRMDEEMERQGYHAVPKQLYLSFTEDAEPYAPAETVAAGDGGIRATVVMRVEEKDSDESSAFAMTAVLLVNGKPVDFRLDGNGSEGGVLAVSLDSNRDHIMALSAEDLPVIAGENKVILTVFGYRADQDFYLGACYTEASFRFDTESEGAAIAPCPEEAISVVAIRDRSKLGPYMQQRFLSESDMTDFQSDHYGNYLMTSKPDPTMHFYLDNMSVPGMLDNSKGIMFLFVDGELKPVWNGNRFGAMSVQEGDLLRVITVESGFGTGEQPHVYWCYQETEGAEEWPYCMTYRMKMKIE